MQFYDAVPTWGPHADDSAGLAKIAPRLQACEFMLDQLGRGPEHLLHVPSSLRYDLMPGDDLGIVHKVYVARGTNALAATADKEILCRHSSTDLMVTSTRELRA
jgi:FMN phosphatase YigB (HAD superfamily)